MSIRKHAYGALIATLAFLTMNVFSVNNVIIDGILLAWGIVALLTLMYTERSGG